MDEDLPDFLTLGPLAAQRSGRALDLGSPKQRAVLGLLLLGAPHAVPVGRLVDEVWGGRPGGDPVRSLQVYVSGLRRALAPHGALLVGAQGGYRLAVPLERLDVWRFEQAAAEAVRQAEAGDHEAAARTAAEALALWRGEAWQDLQDVPALAAAAVRLAEQRLDLQVRSAASRLALGQHRDLVPELEELVGRHPLREDLRGQLMLALHRAGRQPEALAAYAEGRARKVEETGLEPGSALRELHARILADDPGLVVEDADLRARRHLPAQLTRLVGREREVAELTALLRDPGCRLLTVTGPGGIGKTRVGLQVAHELAQDFPDGVWFVGLADLTDHRLVPQLVAEALGVEESGDDFLGPLVQRVAGARLLLLLDNFEQVEEAGPLLTQLLAAGDGVRMLVTSRTRLRLYGEHVRPLAALEPEAAVPLFVERARSVDRRFDGSATEDIRRVCDALDRIPLALELGAARVDDVPLTQMVTQLEARLDLASQGPQDRSPRQQTLRNAIGWSVALLAPREAEAFRRLGVFVGGFDTDAAREVAGAGSAELASLVRSSLLAEEGPRYRMLETVREYAAELAADVLVDVREAHADWFLGLAEASVEALRGQDRAVRVERLQLERGNMRAALQHLDDRLEDDPTAPERMLRMAAALGLFWYRTSPGTEEVEWLDRALALATDADPHLRGRGWYALAICRGEQGRAEEAIAHGSEAYHLLRDRADETWLARVLNTLSGLTRDLGRPEQAVPMMDESIALRRRLGDPTLPLSIALANRAMTALDLGDLVTARACLDECVAEAVAQGADVELALARTGLADVALAEGAVDDAAELLGTSVPVLREAGERYRLVECLDSFAALAVRRGLPGEAAVLVAAADRAMAEDGAVQVPADARLREARVGHALASLTPAERTEAERTGTALDLGQALERASDHLLP